MHYDLEIVIPVSFHGKYGDRVENFKKFGIMNIKDKKLLLTLLVGPEKSDTINSGWPANLDLQIVNHFSTQETAKTYSYFSNYSDEPKARWTAKFDDDTVTDVSDLVDKLDLEFDHLRDYYVVTEMRPEQHHQEDKILRDLGYERWFNAKNVIWHELEGCVVSQSAMKKIITNPTALALMSRRAKLSEGYNDYCLACAARICKIYPCDAYFLSRLPLIGDFSIFGEHLSHIHDLAPDKNAHCIDLMQRMMRRDMGFNTKLYEEVVNKEFIFSSPQGMHIIKLRENGLIGGLPAPSRFSASQPKIWHVKPTETLEFLRSDGALYAVFDDFENSNELSGYYHTPITQDKPLIRKLA